MFDCPPSVELLTALARGSLRQDLPHAVRLWVILHSIYGESMELGLEHQFSYTEWRDRFFTQTRKINNHDEVYHQRDKVPPLHDPNCNCARTMQDWLFDDAIGMERRGWSQAFLQLYPMAEGELDRLLETGFSGSVDRPTKSKQAGRKPLPDGRLFAVTGKLLHLDFSDLVELGCLERVPNQTELVFQKVESLPELIVGGVPLAKVDLNEVLANVIETDAIDLFEHLGQPIRGVQRLFIDIEYIVPSQLSGQVRQLQQQLRQVWERDPVVPIRLSYRSARLFGDVGNYIVYPVCIRYFQRAPYLFAYGHNPRSDEWDNWYDFRLDRIENLEILEWKDAHESLQDRCLKRTPPCPKMVRRSLSEVWGFDIYSPPETLVVRFNPYFHAHYVANTEREILLRAVNTDVVTKLVRASTLEITQQKSLIKLVEKKPNDIYCRVDYRAEDRNVLMRLRAWGPNVEVLLPWSLRVQMAKDMQETWKLYQSVLE